MSSANVSCGPVAETKSKTIGWHPQTLTPDAMRAARQRREEMWRREYAMENARKAFWSVIIGGGFIIMVLEGFAAAFHW